MSRLTQLVIAGTSIPAIWLVNQHSPDLRALAAVFGLLGQPFWFWTSFQNKQWGVFVSCFFFAGAWIYGLYNWSQI